MSTEPASLPSSLSRFADALTESTTASRELVDTVKVSERARRKQNFLLTVAIVVILAMVVLILGMALSTRSTQATIESCTNPSGTCARRGASRTGVLLQGLNQAEFNSTYIIGRCQVTDPTLKAFEACVKTSLAQAKNGTLVIPQIP